MSSVPETNINQLNLECWHNWICGPPAAKFTRLSAHKSSLIGCYGRITNITNRNLLVTDRCSRPSLVSDIYWKLLPETELLLHKPK